MKLQVVIGYTGILQGPLPNMLRCSLRVSALVEKICTLQGDLLNFRRFTYINMFKKNMIFNHLVHAIIRKRLSL